MLALSVHTLICTLIVSVVDADQRLIRREAHNSENTMGLGNTCTENRAMGTNQDANRVFYLQAPGSKDCTNPCHIIHDLVLCREAITHLKNQTSASATDVSILNTNTAGEYHVPELNTETVNPNPAAKNCVWDATTSMVSYNPTQPELNAGQAYTGKPVCLREMYPAASTTSSGGNSLLETSQCPAGYVPIVDVEECNTAMIASNRPAMPAFSVGYENEYEEFPHGCFVHNEPHEMVGFNHETNPTGPLQGTSMCKPSSA